MKLAAHQVAGVLANPASYTGFLFYGDDTGRMRDHVLTATRAVIGTSADPFRLAVLTREEQGRLRDEAGALALGGGRRVIRVQEAADALAPLLDALTKYQADALILLEGSGLTPRSKLRTLAEKHPSWGVIGCYPETGAALSAEIKRTLGSAGLTIDSDALSFLTAELAGDTARCRGELEKLSLYASTDGVVTLEAAEACCALGLDATLGAAVSAALAGQAARCDALMDELGRDGATGPAVLAVLANQVQRILKVRVAVDAGQSVEQACRGLYPPVFPRQMPAFQQEVQRWPTPRLQALGRAVRDADMACKRAASPDLAIAARLLTSVAGRAGGRAGE